MRLLQIFLPLYDNTGMALPQALFAEVRTELLACFGGLTAYTRAPAQGLWDDGRQFVRDDVVIYEVMIGDIDHSWWAGYKRALGDRFKQREILIRAQLVDLL